MPIERWPKVEMPKGQMRVAETYDTFSLDGSSDWPRLGYSGGYGLACARLPDAGPA